MTSALPEDSLLQYRGTVVFMSRLYTYYWLGFMDNVWNVESIVFRGGKPEQSMAIVNTISGLISLKGGKPRQSIAVASTILGLIS